MPVPIEKFKINIPLLTFFVFQGARFMILHNVKNEDGIKNFFQDVYEAYIKVCSFVLFSLNK